MTKDQIEADFDEYFSWGGWSEHDDMKSLIISYAQHIADIAIKEENEACAKVCGTISNDHWNTYKHGNSPGRADPHYQGLSMGAEECEEAIQARTVNLQEE